MIGLRARPEGRLMPSILANIPRSCYTFTGENFALQEEYCRGVESPAFSAMGAEVGLVGFSGRAPQGWPCSIARRRGLFETDNRDR